MIVKVIIPNNQEELKAFEQFSIDFLKSLGYEVYKPVVTIMKPM